MPVLLPYLKDKKEILLLREVVLTVTSSPEVDHYLSIPGQVWLAVLGRHILSNQPSHVHLQRMFIYIPYHLDVHILRKLGIVFIKNTKYYTHKFVLILAIILFAAERVCEQLH